MSSTLSWARTGLTTLLKLGTYQLSLAHASLKASCSSEKSSLKAECLLPQPRRRDGLLPCRDSGPGKRQSWHPGRKTSPRNSFLFPFISPLCYSLLNPPLYSQLLAGSQHCFSLASLHLLFPPTSSSQPVGHPPPFSAYRQHAQLSTWLNGDFSYSVPFSLITLPL